MNILIATKTLSSLGNYHVQGEPNTVDELFDSIYEDGELEPIKVTVDRAAFDAAYATVNDEFASGQVRFERDRLLAESDIAMLPDRYAAMSEEIKTAWSEYRQGLRDITSQAGFPHNVVWPFKP